MEVLDELRRMARKGEVRLSYRGRDLNPDRQPITLDTAVLLPSKRVEGDVPEVG
jgi:hypothetical protein